MPITTTQDQTPKSCYDRIKQYIPCSNTISVETGAPRTYFSLAKQYLPTSIYLFAGIGTCVNAYNGDGLSALYYAGGGLGFMLLHDTCLGGPPAPIITPQHIVDLENQQARNEQMLETAATTAAHIEDLEEKQRQDLQYSVSAITNNNTELTHGIDIENNNGKEGDLLIEGLSSTLSTNANFLKNLKQRP
jgi:hypothetical protein